MKVKSLFRFDLFFIRVFKFYRLLSYLHLLKFLLRGIVPCFEHENTLKNLGKLGSLVDCGANKGQFALMCYTLNKFKTYIAFDPILKPELFINFLKSRKVNTIYKKIALSNNKGESNFYITERDDSSSLKKPKNTAIKYFSDVYEVDQNIVKVNKLNSFSEIIIATKTPRLLKIDVQGNEFELLVGSNDVLVLFKFIIVECTYFDLYEDSKYFSDDIEKFLMQNNFQLKKEYNKLVRRNKLISSDKLYVNLGL